MPPNPAPDLPLEQALKFATDLAKRKKFEGLPVRIHDGSCSNADIIAVDELLQGTKNEETKRILVGLRSVIATRIFKPAPSQGVDSTFSNVPAQMQVLCKKFIEKTIIPIAEMNRHNPEHCTVELMKAFQIPRTKEALMSIFSYFSAHDMLLGNPLHLVGRAIIRYSEENPTFQGWLRELHDGEVRLDWIRENIRKTESEADQEENNKKVQAEAGRMIAHFESNYAGSNQQQLEKQVEDHFSSGFFQQQQQLVAYLAQMISSTRVLGKARMALAVTLVKCYSTNAQPLTSGEILPDMIVSIEALKAKIKRLNKTQSAPTEQAKARKVKPRPKAPETKKLPPDQQAVRQRMQAIMRNSDRTEFIGMLRKALAEWGPAMGIDPNPANITFRAAGGTSVVVDMKYQGSKKSFVARCNIESVGEGKDAQYARQLAKREYETQKKVNHSNIVKCLDFKALPLDLESDGGAISVMMSFQCQELVDRALTGHSIINHMEADRHTPKPRDILELMHKLFVPVKHMHDLDVTHRDVKPDNLMIIPPTSGPIDLHTILRDGTVIFLDLGIARDNSQDSEVTYSSPELVPGTAAFIAPECYSDGTKTRNSANDVYALGITLYYFITGQNSSHAFNQSRNVPIDMNNPRVVGASIGALYYDALDGKNPESVVSINDPGIQRFLNQKHGMVEMEETLAWKIVQLVIRMCQPDPTKRPTMEECLAFTESDGEFFEAPKPKSEGGILGALRKFGSWFSA